MKIRSAKPEDLSAILELLHQVSLPLDGVAEHLSWFRVADVGASLAGVVGLEIYPEGALLRSLAVAPNHRNRGTATLLCDRIEAEATRHGVAEIFLLTETADAFFSRRGYVVAARVEAPQDIATTVEFATICAASARLMRRAIG